MKHQYKTYAYYTPPRVEQYVNHEVTRPIVGFDQKFDAGTKKDQLAQTHEQVRLAAEYYQRKGYSDQKIERVVGFFKR